MRSKTVDIQSSAGRILCCTILRPTGRKLLAKGHVLSDEDVRLLENEGMREVWVTELEDGEIGEDDAVLMVAKAMCCGAVEIRLAAGGRANLVATEDSCLLIDDDVLKQINFISSVVIATLQNFRHVKAGERVATVKSAPFAVAQSHLDAILQIISQRGSILQVRPIRNPSVATLYTDPLNGDRARTLFEGVVRGRIERYGGNSRYSLAAVEDEETVARSLQHLLRTKPDVLLVASTTAPAGPEDVIGRSFARVGANLERFLAPVEPGNLMLLSYKDETPIVSAPCCYRSPKANVLDSILPPMMAKCRITGYEIASLGHGGLMN